MNAVGDLVNGGANAAEVRSLETIIRAVQDAFAQPQATLEWAILLGSLLLAAALSSAIRRAPVTVTHDLARGSVRRLSFPLLAIALMLCARGAFHFAGHHSSPFIDHAIVLLVALAIVRMGIFALRQAFSPSGWLASFEHFIAIVVWSLIALQFTGLLPDVIAWLDSITLPLGKQSLSLWTILHGSLWVLAMLLFALWLAGLVEHRLMQAQGLDSSIRIVVSRVVKALLSFLAILIVLPLVGIDLSALSVFGGALGVGLGFGLQKIMANYVSGFIILLDRSIRLGNVISVSGVRGQVTQITTRYTVLRKVSGTEVLVPNETLIGSIIESDTLSDTKILLTLKLQVAYNTDLERAMAMMEQAARDQKRVLADPPPVAFVEAFADSGVNMGLGFWIDNPEEGSRGTLSDIHLAIWRMFKAENIEIPFPQQEIRILPTKGRDIPQEN